MLVIKLLTRILCPDWNAHTVRLLVPSGASLYRLSWIDFRKKRNEVTGTGICWKCFSSLGSFFHWQHLAKNIWRHRYTRIAVRRIWILSVWPTFIKDQSFTSTVPSFAECWMENFSRPSRLSCFTPALPEPRMQMHIYVYTYIYVCIAVRVIRMYQYMYN